MEEEAKSDEPNVKFMKKRTHNKHFAQSKSTDTQMRKITEELAE
jgi:hypothetical protein